jgi:hypothetical protein
MHSIRPCKSARAGPWPLGESDPLDTPRHSLSVYSTLHFASRPHFTDNDPLVDLVPDYVRKLAAPPTGENQESYAVRACLAGSYGNVRFHAECFDCRFLTWIKLSSTTVSR